MVPLRFEILQPSMHRQQGATTFGVYAYASYTGLTVKATVNQ